MMISIPDVIVEEVVLTVVLEAAVRPAVHHREQSWCASYAKNWTRSSTVLEVF
jgi:hypothetical protein